MHKLGIEIFGMIETNLSWTHDAQKTLAAMIRMKFDYSSLSTLSAQHNKEEFLPSAWWYSNDRQGTSCGARYEAVCRLYG